MMSHPIRPAQTVSCSTAAARNVSHAATPTFLPASCRFFASLAMEVVLPEPFTPAIMTTVGPLGVDTSSFTGFDIFYDPTANTNVAFASLRVNLVDQFYTIDLTTGAAALVGNLGAIDVLSVAAAPAAVPEPAGVGLVGLGALAARLARRGGRREL